MGKGPRIKKIPPGDNRTRLVCPDCDYIHYDNPKVVVGVVATWKGKYLLCRRAIEPRRGYWTVPAGFMELGESPLEGALRECAEEAEAQIDSDGLLAIYHIRHIGQVQMLFRGEVKNGSFRAGEESLECALFDYEEIPWEELAFPTVDWALRQHWESRQQPLKQPYSNPGELKAELPDS